MFIFGHLGIGSRIVKPFSRGLRLRFVLLGTLLPDLIDKPLYYSLSWSTGLTSDELGLISGTRTFGHTALLLLAISGVAVWRRSRILAAIALGVSSHLFLDMLGDYFSTSSELARSLQAISADSNGPGTLNAILFPFLGFDFPDQPFLDADAHLQSFNRMYIWLTEILGLSILSWEYWKWWNRKRILREGSEKLADRIES